MTVKGPGGGGPPKRKISWEQVQELAKLDCTIPEISAVIGMCSFWLNERCKEECGKTLGELCKEYREVGKVSLRRALSKKAIDEGDGPTLRFLAENRLGYGSKVDHTVEVSRDTQVEEAFLKTLSKEELALLRDVAIRSKNAGPAED